MKTAMHYVGALVVVILGVWIAGALNNPINNLRERAAPKSK